MHFLCMSPAERPGIIDHPADGFRGGIAAIIDEKGLDLGPQSRQDQRIPKLEEVLGAGIRLAAIQHPGKAERGQVRTKLLPTRLKRRTFSHESQIVCGGGGRF